MIHQVNEIPVTYLNKGNIYLISIIDTAPAMPGSIPVQYRTSICVSFEDTQQGPRPATRWNFWEEGRGTDEFHQRGGKMQGVEYMETQVVTEGDGRTRVNLETASLDRFSVLWTGGSSASVDCHIAMRFNFLSTDFSHSKGVKGIPSRLCAKTEIVSADSLYCSSQVPEICFCEVKVFRDHGAERKLANDIASVKTSIDKLKQQLAQAETRMKDSRKRKRNGSIAGKIMRGRPDTDTKQKRTQSILSASPTEEDLYIKLQIMQDTLLSTQPVSLLNIRGQE
jgi:CP2 transcription factor